MRASLFPENTDAQVPAIKQRGTERRTSAERTEDWHERCMLRRERRKALRNAAPDADIRVKRTKKKRAAPQLPKKPKTQQRQHYLWRKYAKLPQSLPVTHHIATPVSQYYDRLHARAESLLPDVAKDQRVARRLSKLITKLSRLQRAHARLEKKAARTGRALPLAEQHLAGIESVDPRELFSSAFESILMHHASLRWISRSRVAVVSSAVALVKMKLDVLLREENARRRAMKLGALKSRKSLNIAGKNGQMWLRHAADTASNTVDLCEQMVTVFPNAHANVRAFKEVFRPDHTSALGARHNAATLVMQGQRAA